MYVYEQLGESSLIGRRIGGVPTKHNLPGESLQNYPEAPACTY